MGINTHTCKIRGDKLRTRRNIMKMGVILASSAVAGANSAHAVPSVVCRTPEAPNFSSCNCFLKGTRIETAEGERKIEDLAIGDLLPTMFGGLRPVQWIGRYPIKKSDPSKPWVKDALPVRIAASALAPDVPHADLYVTAFHSLLIDGVLVPAKMLINGTTITRYEPESDEFEFSTSSSRATTLFTRKGLRPRRCWRSMSLLLISLITFDDTERPLRKVVAAPRSFVSAGVRN
jgi:hypothetical protein